ncbi:MAG TPA: class I SAM-dependent methyltransferase [Novimethylophilus sp.]|jgi:demethylmenaquinone methyltransferase/2-methoxy-6-polyprenyl-1,4-benzoquinol methylase|uniref:class I SAM-dependent methyltransferase n=1 Tax=Novimethylophilus sp. TaxID=2137426 RepID=UPI002F3F329D
MLELSIGTWRVTIRRTVPQTTDLARMYDAAAWLWHPILGLLGYSRAYARLFAELASDGWLGCLRDGAKVLDGGIGTGAFSMALTKTIPNALEIHGMDIAPRMLARARDNLRRSGLTAQLRYGNVDCLPYAEGDFDMVMSAHMLEHSTNPSETVREMARVLRAGAPLLIVTTRADRISALHGLRWRYRSVESQQLRQWMYQAGLCDVRCYALDGGLSLPGPLSEAYIGRKITGGRAIASHPKEINT